MVASIVLFTLLVALGTVIGIMVALSVLDLLDLTGKEADKRRIKTAMKNEDYYNQLYEECLTEEMDKKAEEAAKAMGNYDYYS